MRCAVTVKGKVQDVGYREIVEAHANAIGLSGFVFNDQYNDRIVNLICDGPPKKIGFADARDISSYDSEIDEFIHVIDVHEGGISVDGIDKFEIDSSFPLPQEFSRLQTDTLREVGRKLDKGNKFLEYLNEGQTKLVGGQDKMVKGQDELIKGQDKGFSSMIKVLEKIADKL